MNMVERIAKSIYEGRNGSGCTPWSEQPKSHREPYKADARAALLAMLEPSKAMLGEASKAMSPGKRPTQAWVSVNEKHTIRYQAMIGKALEE